MDEWGDFFPRFREKEEDNLSLHVINFNQYMDKLNIHHEDALMKMFMYSLEGNSKQWHGSLPVLSISSLKYFCVAFYLYCKIIYPAECLFDL